MSFVTEPLPATSVRNYFLKLDKHRGGTNTLLNEARTGAMFAKVSTNLQQVQDGIWETRPGLQYYGNAISGMTEIDGAVTYKNGSSLEIITVAHNGTTGYVYKSTNNASTWSQVTPGLTFTPNKKTFFLQIGGNLYVTNGTDNLTVYNGTSLSRYTAISNPSAPLAAPTTLTTGSYTNKYQIVAVNTIGFTAGSSQTTQTTNKERGTWSGTEKVTLTITPVAGATGYQIFWTDDTGSGGYIGETTATTYEDFGTNVPNPYIEVPSDNTTGAPKFTSMEVSGNRIWGTKDPSNKWRVYFSGTGVYLGYFSPFYGGGYIDLEKGSINEPQAVVHYRTGKGDPVVTVLCSDPYGNGTIFQVEITSTTVGDETFSVPVAYKIVGATGGDSPFFVAKVNDDLMFGSKKRISSLRNKEQIFNVLSTPDLTSPVRPDYETLNHKYIDRFVAYYKSPRVYFSMVKSLTATENDITAVFDIERNNWNWAWDKGFKGMFEYVENNTTSQTNRFLAFTSGSAQLTEIADNVKGDYGAPFYQEYVSGLIPVSKDMTDLAKIRDAIFEIGSLSGKVYVEVLGYKKDSSKETLASGTLQEVVGSLGLSSEFFSGLIPSGSTRSSSFITQSSRKKTLRIGKKIYHIQFRVYAYDVPTRFQFLSVQAKGFLIASRPDSSWN